VCAKINQGIRVYLERHGIPRVAELTGTLRLNQPGPIQCGC
jgi:hypothetical protein